MWRLLRECFPDVRFRRQVPIRDFVADFASHGLKPVVEAEGYRVLRFWNHDVLGNGDGVMTVLAPFCGDSTPTHEQVRIAPRSEAMSGGHGDLLISPIKGEGS
ncbi:MAG: hypothetical protein QOD42_2011 [Sphingomonadales bacterium]|jgi:very-short-patch-repair endonuclease|nr:hypothetical protein [Sphingomonadales bacterium]